MRKALQKRKTCFFDDRNVKILRNALKRLRNLHDSSNKCSCKRYEAMIQSVRSRS